MRTLSQIYSDSDSADTDMFALGSSQYLGIYRYYRDYKMFEATSEVDKMYGEMISFLSEATQEIYTRITEEAKQWGETPNLAEWKHLELKVKLLTAKATDIEDILKRTFSDFFELLKNQSWDLWSALGFCIERYPEIHEYVIGMSEPVEPTGDKQLGMIVYFFSEKLDLDDKEVKEIFGGFDT